MSSKLQQKWKVSGTQFALIICTFAIGGSLTGYAARKLMPLFDIDNAVLWTIIYLLIVTLLWPLAVILVSFPFGQFAFFTKYLRKVGSRMGIVKIRNSKFEIRNDEQQTAKSDRQTNIAIFASGAGSNAKKIIEHFRDHSTIKIKLIVCNKPGAGVLQIAKNNNIETLLIEKEKFFLDGYVDVLKEKGIGFIILAGFLWKLPSVLISAYSNNIINIHPALLPKYGGKGMYGHHVHETVINNRDKESGITIHYVDEVYDHGKIIFQSTCPVNENDTADTLAHRIHQLEHRHYPRVIESLLSKHSS